MKFFCVNLFEEVFDLEMVVCAMGGDDRLDVCVVCWVWMMRFV